VGNHDERPLVPDAKAADRFSLAFAAAAIMVPWSCE